MIIELEKELQELKDKINDIERRYSFVKDYKLITTLLDKSNIVDITLTREEIENNNSIYIVENNYNEVHIYKEEVIKSE